MDTVDLAAELDSLRDGAPPEIQRLLDAFRQGAEPGLEVEWRAIISEALDEA